MVPGKEEKQAWQALNEAGGGGGGKLAPLAGFEGVKAP